MAQFNGKAAIITGAGSGMGKATALLLAARGASVMAADINEKNAEAVAEQIVSLGGKAIHCAVDVGDESAIKHMVEYAVSTFGRLDILHNNAGSTGPEYAQDSSVSVDAMDLELWNHHMRVNLQGPMLGMKWAIPEMLKQGRGAIVNTSSNASLGGQEGTTAYGVSKAGLNTLTQYVATAYGRRGIRCNAIIPGLVMSPAATSVPAEALTPYLDNNLIGHPGEPKDVANLVAFLVSDDARYITGQLIAIDGGTSAHAPWYSDLIRYRAKSMA